MSHLRGNSFPATIPANPVEPRKLVKSRIPLKPTKPMISRRPIKPRKQVKPRTPQITQKTINIQIDECQTEGSLLSCYNTQFILISTLHNQYLQFPNLLPLSDLPHSFLQHYNNFLGWCIFIFTVGKDVMESASRVLWQQLKILQN